MAGLKEKDPSYLSKENKGSMLADPIPVKVLASTLKDSVAYWLETLKTRLNRLRKHRGRKARIN